VARLIGARLYPTVRATTSTAAVVARGVHRLERWVRGDMSMQTGLPAVAVRTALVTAAAACAGSGQQFATDYDPPVASSHYRTFALVSRPDSGSQQLIDDRVRQAVEAQLAARGLTESDRHDAGLFAGYGVVDHTRQAVYTAPWGTGVGNRTSGGWRGGSTCQTRSRPTPTAPWSYTSSMRRPAASDGTHARPMCSTYQLSTPTGDAPDQRSSGEDVRELSPGPPHDSGNPTDSRPERLHSDVSAR